MSQNLAYTYAYIDPDTKMCMEVRTMSYAPTFEDENWVEIPVDDIEYIGKFYINGNWYEDAEGTIPWTSSLL